MNILDWIYPPKCVFCHRLMETSKTLICEDCRRDVPRTARSGLQKVPFVPICVAPYYYEKDVKESLHRFKFFGCTGYAKVYAPAVAEVIRAEIAAFDVLTWVPISRKRMRKRGYDQAQLLAKEVGKLIGVRPLRTLKKIRHTPPQSQTGGAEKRKANIAGAYAAVHPERFAGKRVLILDDILTTGATVSECARILGRAGAERVYCATVARSRSGG